MADPVSGSLDARHALMCEPEPEVELVTPLPPAAPLPASQPVEAPVSNSVVSALVVSYRRTVPAQQAPYLTLESAVQCASGGVGVVLAALAGKGPVLGTIIGLKAGFDIGKCFADQHARASEAATELKVQQICAAEGGQITAVVGDTSVCEVRGARR